MPARMWRRGIHSFLELLRNRLPDSLDHMLAFLYLAYFMMGLLMESEPSFIETWVECLGDLARYRMAIEVDIRDREIWSGFAKMWYEKAANKSPEVGKDPTRYRPAALLLPKRTWYALYTLEFDECHFVLWIDIKYLDVHLAQASFTTCAINYWPA